jgi:hypothetical protein
VDHVKDSEPGCAAEREALLPRLLRAADPDLPVLPATRAELARLSAMQERVTQQALAALVLRDPFFTLRVLRYLAHNRTRSQTADITTVGHALMMLGHARFFQLFGDVSSFETLAEGTEPTAVMRLASRARLAALLARDWAAARNDVEPEEVMVAALLHPIPEVLAAVAGEPMPDSCEQRTALREALFAQLAVPGLAAPVREPSPAPDPRRWNVRLACRLARHISAGWPRAAVAADLQELQRFLRTSEPQAWERVRKPLLAAAREWHYYGVVPAAAHMPLVFEDSDTL